MDDDWNVIDDRIKEFLFSSSSSHISTSFRLVNESSSFNIFSLRAHDVELDLMITAKSEPRRKEKVENVTVKTWWSRWWYLNTRRANNKIHSLSRVAAARPTNKQFRVQIQISNSNHSIARKIRLTNSPLTLSNLSLLIEFPRHPSTLIHRMSPTKKSRQKRREQRTEKKVAHYCHFHCRIIRNRVKASDFRSDSRDILNENSSINRH